MSEAEKKRLEATKRRLLLTHSNPNRKITYTDYTPPVPEELPLSFQTEPVVGRRLWTVYDFETRSGKEPRLAPIVTAGGGFYPTMRRMEAFCTSTHHEAPWRGCHCGIWAVKSDENLAKTATHYGSHQVWGEIYLWGRIIEAEIGYRAQYAYPKKLYTAREDLAAPLAALYGVPVELAERLSPEAPTPGLLYGGGIQLRGNSGRGGISLNVPNLWTVTTTASTSVDWSKVAGQWYSTGNSSGSTP